MSASWCRHHETDTLIWMVNSVRGWVPIVSVTDTSAVLGGTRRRY